MGGMRLTTSPGVKVVTPLPTLSTTLKCTRSAAAGADLAWVPRWLVRERIGSGELVRLFPDEPGHLYEVHAVWLQAPHTARRLRVTVDALSAALPAMMI